MSIEKLALNAPPIPVVDLLAIEVLKFAGRVIANTSNLVVRERCLLARDVHYNNHLELFDMHLHGDKFEFTNATTGHRYEAPVFRTRAYRLLHDQRHYLVLVRRGGIEYVGLTDPEALTADRLNAHIEQVSTVDQLKVFWQDIDRYERALQSTALQHSHQSLLAFIENSQREARSTFKLYEVRVSLGALQF